MNDSRDLVDLLRQELDYRRSKQWDIFSWCSTLLIAIAGGVIALQGQQTFSLHLGQKIITTVAVAVLAAYAFVWLTHHASKESLLRDRITQETTHKIWDPRSRVPGERVAVIVLGVAAWAAIWSPVR